jgi:large subunit ribosomal protein L13
MIIINAENQITGRIAAFAAKQALLGEKVEIINCEKAVMTGSRTYLLAKYKRKRELGSALMGPIYLRKPEMIMKRIVRGMLPYKKEKGERALKDVMCYRGIPDNAKPESFVKVPGADISKVPSLKYLTVGEISKMLGAKF